MRDKDTNANRLQDGKGENRGRGECNPRPATGEKALMRPVSISGIPAAVLTGKPKGRPGLDLRPTTEQDRHGKTDPPTPPEATAESCQFPS